MDWVLPRKKSSWFEGKLWRYDLNHRRGQTGETCFQIQNWYKDIIIIISNINFQSFEFWGLDKIIFSIHKVHQKIFLLKSLWINCINFECWKRINRNQTTYKLIQWCKEYSLFFGIYQPKHTNSKPPLKKIIVLNQISTEARIPSHEEEYFLDQFCSSKSIESCSALDWVTWEWEASMHRHAAAPLAAPLVLRLGRAS